MRVVNGFCDACYGVPIFDYANNLLREPTMHHMPLQNRKRRNIVSNMIGWDAVSNSLEQRIVPAYVSGDFGWASSFETTQLYANNIIPSSAVDSQGNIYQLGSFTGTFDFDTSIVTYNISSSTTVQPYGAVIFL